MIVAAVIVGRGTYEASSEWINPGARTDASLAAVQTGAVCIRAAGAKMLAAYTIAPKSAPVGRCRRKGVLTPGLTDLFEPVVVSSSATHSVKILRNKRVVIARQSNQPTFSVP